MSEWTARRIDRLISALESINSSIDGLSSEICDLEEVLIKELTGLAIAFENIKLEFM